MRIQLSHPSWTCHQPWLLSQRVTAVCLVRKTLRCDQSISLPEGALDDVPIPPYLLQERETPTDASCLGCQGRGLCTNQPQLTSLAWRLLQGCSHTVETRFGAHFQFHIPQRSSFLRWVFFPFTFEQKIFFYSEPSTSHLRNPGILILSKCAGTAQAWSAGGWMAGRAGHPWDRARQLDRVPFLHPHQALAANSSSAMCQTAHGARRGQSWSPPASSPCLLPAPVLPT